MMADWWMSAESAIPLACPCLLAWAFGLNDASLMAWVIVLGYVVAAASCLRAWRGEVARSAAAAAGEAQPTEGSRYAPRLWLAVAALLILLAFNKQLDLHVLLSDYGRRLARTGGWYEGRRRVQLLFAVAVGTAASGAVALVAWRLRTVLSRYALLLAGLWLLAVFIGLRVASFHHVDAWFGRRLRGVKLHWIVELIAISLVTAAALLSLRKPQRTATADQRRC